MTHHPIVLFPANGMHPIAYTPLIQALNMPEPSRVPLSIDAAASPHPSQYIIYPPLQSPTPPVPNPLHWLHIWDAIQPQLQWQEPCIGIGHSLGGTLLLYDAIKNPNRWSRIIIIEPALFSPFINKVYNIVQWSGLSRHIHPMVRLTKQRKADFSDPDTVFERWRPRSQFKYLSDTALRYFIEATLIKQSLTNLDTGSDFIEDTTLPYTLRFTKEWELEIYHSMCTLDPTIWRELPTLKPSLHTLAGAQSNTFLAGARKRLKKYSTQFITPPNTTHMLPFEDPDAICELIKTGSKP